MHDRFVFFLVLFSLSGLLLSCNKERLPQYVIPDNLICYDTTEGHFTGTRNGITWCGGIDVAENKHLGLPISMGIASAWPNGALAESIGISNLIEYDSIAYYQLKHPHCFYRFGEEDEFYNVGFATNASPPKYNFLQIDSIRADGKRYYGHLNAHVQFNGYEPVLFKGSFWFQIK